MGDPQGDLRPGTPILVGFFTEISKKWVLDSKSLRISLYVEPPKGGVCAFAFSFSFSPFFWHLHNQQPIYFANAHWIDAKKVSRTSFVGKMSLRTQQRKKNLP